MKLGLILIFTSGVSLLAGCSGDDRPETASVRGTVTLDGKPLYPAVITFQPVQGRASHAELSPAGEYDLNYIRDDKGAILGHHTVRIDTAGEESTNIGKKFVPMRYNRATTLTANVEAGENTLNFDLTSH